LVKINEKFIRIFSDFGETTYTTNHWKLSINIKKKVSFGQQVFYKGKIKTDFHKKNIY